MAPAEAIVQPVALRRRAATATAPAHYADLNDMYKKTRAEGFGDEVKRRIMIGTYVLADGYYDAYYLQAQKIRRLIADDFQAAFKECDVIAGAAAPTHGLGNWRQGRHPLADYLADIYTLPASLAGLPGDEPAGRLWRRRHARGPAADRQLLCRRPSC